jgi:hypothetical protein
MKSSIFIRVITLICLIASMVFSKDQDEGMISVTKDIYGSGKNAYTMTFEAKTKHILFGRILTSFTFFYVKGDDYVNLTPYSRVWIIPGHPPFNIYADTMTYRFQGTPIYNDARMFLSSNDHPETVPLSDLATMVNVKQMEVLFPMQRVKFTSKQIKYIKAFYDTVSKGRGP